MLEFIFPFLMAAVALFLIMLVLVQRGRGGGLAGALGGAGGSSAFGAKAGDVFTKITIVSAFMWIVLCVCAVAYFNNTDRDNLTENKAGSNGVSSSEPASDAEASDTTPAEGDAS